VYCFFKKSGRALRSKL